MDSRSIVRDPLVLGGRWTLQGTEIPIALILGDHHKVGQRETRRTYKSLAMTPAEYASILSFEFPEIRTLAINVSLASSIVECVCGEDTILIMYGSEGTVQCICGRKWLLVIAPVLIRD